MDCPIHLGAIALGRVQAAALRCGHVFCLTCINGWLDSKPAREGSCPVCKRKVVRKDIVRLYAQPRSPGSSPAKSDRPGKLSTRQKDQGQVLQAQLESLDLKTTSGGMEGASEEMEQFADAIADTSMDVEAKCLAEEIKSAATRFQTLILPKLKELESLRTQLNVTKFDNTRLSSDLRKRKEQLDTATRENNALKLEVANLKVSKALASDVSSNLRQTLEVTEGKLIDAQNAVHAKDELLKTKEEQLIEYKRWLSDFKAKVQKQTQTINELKRRELAPERAQTVAPSSEFVLETEEDGRQEMEPPAKRRRLDDDQGPLDTKLDKSFLRKPPASFQIRKKEPERRKAGSEIPGLNVTNGQVHGIVAVGSKRRLGKMG